MNYEAMWASQNAECTEANRIQNYNFPIAINCTALHIAAFISRNIGEIFNSLNSADKSEAVLVYSTVSTKYDTTKNRFSIQNPFTARKNQQYLIMKKSK